MSELKVNRATVIEWLDANEIEVTHTQLAGLFASAIEAAPAQPVAHVSQETFNDDGTSDIIIPALPIGMALYAAPQPTAQAQHPDDEAVPEATPAQAVPAPGVEAVSEREFKQFLSDVLTAAGLVTHGKKCKDLGRRLGEMSMRLLTAPKTAAAPVDAESWLDLLAEARAALWQPANAALCERLDAFIDAAIAAQKETND